MRISDTLFRNLPAKLGRRTCWELPFFHEGMLTKIIVKQTGGGNGMVNFKLNIYNSPLACGDNSQSSGGDDPEGTYSADPEMYKVIDTLQGVAGEAVSINSSSGFVYRNHASDPTTKVWKIYVEIEPEGSGNEEDATWDLALAGWKDIR